MAPGGFRRNSAHVGRITSAVRAVLDQYLGPKFPWYIVVGNHEVENAAVMPWVDIYRADPSGGEYKLRQTVALE